MSISFAVNSQQTNPSNQQKIDRTNYTLTAKDIDIGSNENELLSNMQQYGIINIYRTMAS